MNFSEILISEGYVFDDEDYDGCYVKQDSKGFIHCYQEGEDEGAWNYVKFTSLFSVVEEYTIFPDKNSLPNSVQ